MKWSNKILFVFILLFFSSIILADYNDDYLTAKKYIREKKYNKAISLLNTLKTADDLSLKTKAYFQLGNIYMLYLKNYEKAIENFENIVNINKNSYLADDALYYIGFIYSHYLNDKVKAIDYFNKIVNQYNDSDFKRFAIAQLALIKNKSISPPKEEKSKIIQRAEKKPKPAIIKKRTKRQKKNLIKIDFDNVKLSEFIKTVGKLTNKNFIFDNNIKGNITVISNEGISLDEFYNTFLNILERFNLTAVEEDNIVYIVTNNQSLKKSVFNDTGSVITKIYKLKNIEANKVFPVITPLLSSSNQITRLQEYNLLIITANKDIISKINNLINILEKIGSSKTFYTYKLKYLNADVLQNKLNTFIKNFLNKQDVEILSFPELNAIIIGADEQDIPLIVSLCEEFDVDYNYNIKTKVFSLKYAYGEDLLETINQSLGVIHNKKSQENTKVLYDKRLNSIIVSSLSGNAINAVEKLIKELDHPSVSRNQKVHIYKLVNSNALKLADKLNTLYQAETKSGEVKFVADEQTNSLIITSPPILYNELIKIIKDLDSAKKQVLVEVALIEASIDKTRQLGVEFGFKPVTLPIDVNGANPQIITGSNYGISSTVIAQNEALKSGQIPTTQATGLIGAVKHKQDFFGIINALDENEDFKILATSHIISNDNEKAQITVGEVRPFTKGLTFAATSGNSFQDISYEDVGILLEITPRINIDDQVTMEIHQQLEEVADASTTSSSSSDIIAPTRRKREIKTIVTAPDKTTVVLGGQIRNTETKIVQTVPFLGKIPILKHLFSNESKGIRKTNLLIFIKPTILSDKIDLDNITKEKSEEQNLHFEGLKKNNNTSKQKILKSKPEIKKNNE